VRFRALAILVAMKLAVFQIINVIVAELFLLLLPESLSVFIKIHLTFARRTSADPFALLSSACYSSSIVILDG